MTSQNGPSPRTLRYTGIHPVDEQWFAVRTPFKREKLAQKELQRQGVETYLPLLHEVRRYASKNREVDIPLIRSYLFVRINESGYHPVVACPYVSGFIRFGDHIVAVPEEEMDLLRRIVGEAGLTDAEQGIFEEGDQVEIIGGKLTGIRGTLVERKGKNQVAVALQVIGYSLIMDIDPAHLRRLP